MPEYKWPEMNERKILGKRVSRLDGPDKVTGRAKYSSDVKRPGQLYGKFLRCPYAHARVVSIDISAAEKVPGVKAVKICEGKGPGAEIQWAWDEVAYVAAVDEQTAEDAIHKIVVKYEPLPHLVNEEAISKAGERGKPAAEQVNGDPDKGFQEAEVVVEGQYGIPVITHCCLEPHGQVAEWEGGENLTVHQSTQNVSGLAGQYAQPLQIPASNVKVRMDHIGGGFGSKFSADSWGLETARLAKQAGQPVKAFLERDAELFLAGVRPSHFAKIKVGAKKDGTLVAWESDSWSTGGVGGGGMAPIPYVVSIPNRRMRHTAVSTNTGAARAWRAPNHPQACWLTFAALEDMAAKLKMDPLDFFIKNIELTGDRAELYRKELMRAAELIEWKKNWHPRGDSTPGHLKRGLGLGFHTWGGRGHNCEERLTVNPDGSVTIDMGTQDLGTGTRTAMAMVAAETFGLTVNAIKVNIGRAPDYPPGGASGGSTTIGGVSSATLRAALEAREQLFAKVAPALGVEPTQLEAVGGKVQVKGNPAKSLSWKQATAKLGVTPLTVTGRNAPNAPGKLIDSGVGGVQMADVTVDIETGVTKVNKFVAVQDCGLIINEKTAESQVFGAMIMGVCFSLFEERILDEITGRPLNSNMEFYKLAGIGDIGDLVVEMWKDPEQDGRGVIGLGEPPVNSPAAAIGNAIANAIGVRVPRAPFTPQRVLAALESKGGLTS
ncbi:MAG: xanthine dehydrogenase family protein molybdopterin-binding subunit [Acidobacteriota bacterium]